MLIMSKTVEATRAPRVPTRSDLCFCKVLGMEFTSVNMARQNPLQIGRFNGKNWEKECVCGVKLIKIY